MCILSPREERIDYPIPARVKKVKRLSTYSPSPPRSARYSSPHIIEERRPSGYALPPPDLPSLPPPAPSVYPEPPAPPPAPSTHHSSTNVESRRSQSRTASRAPSVQTRTRSHFVEVQHDDESSTSSSSSESSDDLRSRTTHKTTNTETTSRTRQTSKSQSTAPATEYSEHEREFRRERTYSRPSDYETYRYVNAPFESRRSISRRGEFDEPRASRGSFRRERERVVIEDDYGRQRRDYRR